MFHKKHMREVTPQNTVLPSYDFIAGLLSATGSFLWVKQKNSEIPVFQLKMAKNEEILLNLVKEKLGLREVTHSYTHKNHSYGLLLIRSRRTIENMLIPLIDGRLFGQKAIEFELWKKKYYEKRLEFIYKKHL